LPTAPTGGRAPIAASGMLSVKAVVGYAVTVLISTGFLTIIYSVVPNARVRLLSAISGAFVASLLWEAAKWGFAYYVKSAFFTKIYGALALLPLFLLWIYIAWMIILLGLFICHRLQTRGTSLISVFGDGRTSIVDPAAVLVVATAAAREFKSGRSVSAPEVARVTGLEQGVAVSMLEALVSHGLMHHVAAGSDEDRYALAKPPEAIPVGECLAAGSSLADQADTDALRGRDASLVSALRVFEEARTAATRGRTLADFLDGIPGATPNPTPPRIQDQAPPASPASATDSGTLSAPSAAPSPRAT
ncbi:MAG TPA: YihY family inner membrane protein, partial [Phycisphaerales bacterium]|nr:YihY family inner membrane protein [Phycisphaerales bacterium]